MGTVFVEMSSWTFLTWYMYSDEDSIQDQKFEIESFRIVIMKIKISRVIEAHAYLKNYST